MQPVTPCCRVYSRQPGSPRRLCSLILPPHPPLGWRSLGCSPAFPVPPATLQQEGLQTQMPPTLLSSGLPTIRRIESPCLHRACRNLQDCALATPLLPHDHTHLTVLQLAVCECWTLPFPVRFWRAALSLSDLDSQKLAKSGSSMPPTPKYPTTAVYTMLSYFYRDKSKPSSTKKPLSRYKP